MSNRVCKYFVEGECEEALINEFKKPENNYFKPGRVEVLNVALEKISKTKALNIKQGTTIFLIYDTDVVNDDILEENVKILAENTLSDVYHIQSFRNFEDEILKSTSLKKITDFSNNVQSVDDFKTEFIRCKNLKTKLESINFNPDLMWATINEKESCSKYTNSDARKMIKVDTK